MPYLQQKTTYVKPICNRKDDQNFYKVVAEPHVQNVSCMNRQNDDLHLQSEDLRGQKERSISLENVSETKERGINAFKSLHSALFSKVEKMQKWKALVEVDTKQKNKKIEELHHLIETFRKVKVELQMQNENLSLQLSNEMQQRNLVLQQHHSAKELFSALKKQFDAVQVHFERRNAIEESFKATDSKRLKAIEDMKIQFHDLCNENADKISYLNSALASEMNKSMTLKENLDQTITEAASKEESLCEILRVRESEIKKLVHENEDKSIKLQKSIHDIDELCKKISEQEKLSEFRLQKMNEFEHKLRITENSKLDFETQYLQEKTKVQDLEEKCKELEEFGNNIKVQSENCVTDLKKINVELESTVEDLKEKVEEIMKENENLILSLRKKEEEKVKLEKEISEITCAKLQLEEQFRASEEKQRHLSEKELENLLMKTKELQQELSIKTDELKSQQENISKLQTTLAEKESTLVSLEYENVEMKDYISSEKNSIKICLECDTLKNEVNKEIDELKQALVKKEEESALHKSSAVEALKMLAETEKNYNNDWMAKEKEVTQHKDRIRSLEEELQISKMKAATVEKVTTENAKLKAELEDLLKQKVSIVEQMTLENSKLKTELEKLLKQKELQEESNSDLIAASVKAEVVKVEPCHSAAEETTTVEENGTLEKGRVKPKNKRLEKIKGENTSSSDEEIKIICERITKAVPKNVQSKTIPRSKVHQAKAKEVPKTIENQSIPKPNVPQTKAKAVSNTIKNQTIPKPNIPQTKEKAVPNFIQKQTIPKSNVPQNTPNRQMDRKRKWECESSDSDSIEWSSIKEVPTQERYSSIIPSRKVKIPKSQLTINAFSTPKLNNFQQKDFLTIEKVDVTPSNQMPHKMFTTIEKVQRTPSNATPKKFYSTIEKVNETPSNSMPRKFFTTPLSARHSSFKKPKSFDFL